MTLAKKGDIILFQLLKKRNDISYQEFVDYWLENHNKIEQEIIHKGQRKKIVAHFVKGVLKGGEVVPGDVPFDAVLELHYNSIEDMKASFDPAIAARLGKDEENFLDLKAERVSYILEEYIMAER